MKKPLSIEVKVSHEEKARLISKAEMLGMSVSGYLRFIGLSAKVQVSP